MRGVRGGRRALGSAAPPPSQPPQPPTDAARYAHAHACTAPSVHSSHPSERHAHVLHALLVEGLLPDEELDQALLVRRRPLLGGPEDRKAGKSNQS